ncbi:MAG: ABC transporter permease [Aestuariivirga sp.]|uniref:ABC transporter permease n=1 Tax=Aestuariivirga sp. TaxID=2650926 RepID=UPI0038D11A7D
MEKLSVIAIIFFTLKQLWPVWLSLWLLVAASFAYRRRLGLYGQLFDSGVGIAGVVLIAFWFFTALFADIISTFDPLQQFVALKHAPPGAIETSSGVPFLFGGDKLARDVFSRMIHGSRIVLIVAPLATALAFAVGIALGLPAGYLGGRIDRFFSFLANLILAFPLILLFYLLVSPGILDTPIPYVMAAVLFCFPITLLLAMVYAGFRGRPVLCAGLIGGILVAGAWLFATFVFDSDPLGVMRVSPSTLNIFVAVAFASSPSVFRIVRGLTMDIKTREYVAAAQTRGESPWYTMLWEILPNARGPLIVDACLRIGYTTIFLGALGYFGLGMPPESPDWGTAIKDASRLLRVAVHPVIPPAVALMSFVLGLNLLADSLREQSLRD